MSRKRQHSEVEEWQIMTTSHAIWTIVLPTVSPALGKFHKSPYCSPRDDFLILLGEVFFPLRVLCAKLLRKASPSYRHAALYREILRLRATALAMLATRRKLLTPDRDLADVLRRIFVTSGDASSLAWFDYNFPIKLDNPFERVVDACFRDQLDVADRVSEWHDLSTHNSPLRVEYADVDGNTQTLVAQGCWLLDWLHGNTWVLKIVELLVKTGHSKSAEWFVRTLDNFIKRGSQDPFSVLAGSLDDYCRFLQLDMAKWAHSDMGLTKFGMRHDGFDAWDEVFRKTKDPLLREKALAMLSFMENDLGMKFDEFQKYKDERPVF